jgi:hypothetical protein
MVLSPRQEKLLAMRDDMGPGAMPAAIVPRNFAEAQAMCQALAAADLVPRAFRGKPVDMLLVVMTGLEVGLPPMASMRLYTTWDGVARLMAEGVRAIILRHPDIEYFEPQSSSDTSATWVAKRRGRPEKSATWTHERAKKAGLLGKENWIKYEEDMLNARASMQLGRMIAPDVMAGMVSTEEARDGDFIEASFTEQKAPAFVAAPPVVVEAPAPTEPAKRGPGRPPKDKLADPTPPQPSSAGSTAPAASSPTSPTASAASTEPTSTPSKLDAAIKNVEEKMAARPTPPASSTAPSPSAESAGASIAPTTSGVVADAPASPAADDGFGDDPVDSTPAAAKLGDFYAWLSECKTQRDLQAGLGKWRMWSQDQAKAGDSSFSKSGENTVAMQTAYGKRKGEVPA